MHIETDSSQSAACHVGCELCPRLRKVVGWPCTLLAAMPTVKAEAQLAHKRGSLLICCSVSITNFTAYCVSGKEESRCPVNFWMGICSNQQCDVRRTRK